MISPKYPICLSVALSLIVLSGCVERTITVRTDPPGALVTVNEVEQGHTPVTFPFTWYGQYRVLVEHPEYQTLQTSRKVDAPIYQWPGIDLIFEVLLPFEFLDHHDWSFTMVPRHPVPTEELIERAEQFRSRAEAATEPSAP